MMDARDARTVELIDQGLAASRGGDAAGAASCFAQAAAAEPAASVAHFLLASELAQAGRFAEAETAYANAVLARPDFHLARYQLGLLQFSSGRAAAALVSWQPLFELASEPALQRFVHGFAALAQDRFDDALACFRDGLAQGVDNEPLAGDIRRVMVRIESLASSPPAPADPQVQPLANEPEPRADVHALLANYQGKRIIH